MENAIAFLNSWKGEKMENQSRKRRVFDTFFVFKPIGFTMFLLFGLITFIGISSNIKIPVYDTIETVVEKEGEHIKLDIGSQELQEDTPIFVYRSRDDYLEKITEYQVESKYIVINSIDDLSDEQKVNVDIQTKEISLLEHIFKNGGNTQ